MTFGDLADTYLATVLRSGSEYHVTDDVFERYREETIKVRPTTRTRRSTAARLIRWLVEGRAEPLPNNWSNVLSLADNK